MTPKNIEDVPSSELKNQWFISWACGITDKEESDVYSLNHTIILSVKICMLFAMYMDHPLLSGSKTTEQLANSFIFSYVSVVLL